MRRRQAGLSAMVLLAALASGESAPAASRGASSSAGCSPGSVYAPDGSCSRCAAALEKAREGCGAARKACSKSCDATNQRCLRDPRALDCDAVLDKCNAGCDTSRHSCFVAREKVFIDCHARERH